MANNLPLVLIEINFVSGTGRETKCVCPRGKLFSNTTVQDMIVYWDVSLINTKSHSPFLDEGFAVIPNRSDCIPAVCNPFDVNFLMFISTRTTTTQFVDAHGM